MTIFGVVVFGMGDWVLTQGSLLRRDDKVWVIALEWGIGFLRRGPSFVGMTIMGLVALEWGIGFLRRGPSFVGMTRFGGVCFRMGDLFLTQGSLLCRDDKVWYLRRGGSFVGMTGVGGMTGFGDFSSYE